MGCGTMAGLIASVCIVTGLIGLAIGARKGRVIAGFLLGLLLSVLGLVIILIMPATEEMKMRRAEEKRRLQQRHRQRRREPLIRRRSRSNGKDLTPQ
jgi:hypothetical protein